MTGPPEPTNDAYAMAKLAGIGMVQAYRRQYGARFICAIPANLYGPHDHFHPEDSHVIPALLRRFHEAAAAGLPDVELWGTGTPVREFLSADDMAAASLFLMDRYDDDAPINTGTGAGTTIRALAETIAQVVGYTGALRFNPQKPDGMPRKVLDTSRLTTLGWTAGQTLADGLADTYAWCLDTGVFSATSEPATAHDG